MSAARQIGLFSGKPERARIDPRSRYQPKPDGYAATPGTGPAGERCGTCTHCRQHGSRDGRHFYKCAVMLPAWTSSRVTDVLLRSPACVHWAAGTQRVTTIRTHND